MSTDVADWVELVNGPVDVVRAISAAQDHDAGGTTCFVGTVRAEKNSEDSRQLIALDYEAYEQMARRQLADLVRQARARWEIVRVVLLHSVGRVMLGEPSVVIVVACPHRAESFEACRWLIEMLKSEVTIWKQDAWS